MRQDERPQHIPLFQSLINNSPLPQRNIVSPITTFAGHHPSPSIATLLSFDDASPINATETQQEKALDVTSVMKMMDELHPNMQDLLRKSRMRMQESRHKRNLDNLWGGNFILVALDSFYKEEKLCLRWYGLGSSRRYWENMRFM